MRGVVQLPADKSIAHRLALLAAIADGNSSIHNYPRSADPQSTLSCLRQLGVGMEAGADGSFTIHGRGLRGLRCADAPLDCGNSGTTMRLLSGILAGQTFASTLTGDRSLRGRPMRRIAEPLRRMGARVDLREGRAPVRIRPSAGLNGMIYDLPVPSAQVKSCVLFAGLYARGTTTVVETARSRDHTERLMGLAVKEESGCRLISVTEGHELPAFEAAIPGDFSAAAFFLVAGSIVPDGAIRLPGVGLNPTRNAFLGVLRDMGADIETSNLHTAGAEPAGDLVVRPSRLRGITIGGAIISNLIDEIPVLAVAALCAEGRTVVRGAAELRVKECDRIAATVTNLRALGADVEEFPDGFAVIGGKPLMGTALQSFDDHRIAMAMGVAALVSSGTTTVHGAQAAGVSFPRFWQALQELAERGGSGSLV